MEWQTKEYIDERFDKLEEKLDMIIDHFKIQDEDTEEDFSDEDDEEEVIA